MGFVNYSNGITIASPTPTGDAGLALQNDLITIANFIGTTNSTLAALGSTYLPLSGGTLTGALTLPINTKLYFGSTANIQCDLSDELKLTGVSGAPIVFAGASGINLNGIPTYLANGTLNFDATSSINADGSGHVSLTSSSLNLNAANLLLDDYANLVADGSGNVTLTSYSLAAQLHGNGISFPDTDGFPLWYLNPNDYSSNPAFTLTNNDVGDYVFIITDNSGDNSTFEFSGSTEVLIDHTLQVTGSSSLDDGYLTTDGAGNVTATSFLTAQNIYVGREHEFNQYNGIWFGVEPTSTSIYNYAFLNTGTDTIVGSSGTVQFRISNVTGLELANSGHVLIGGASDATGTLQVTGTIAISSTQTTTNGAGTGASGSAVFSQHHVGPAYKRVVVYFNALKSPTAISYTYPTAFSHTPLVNGALATYATATATSVSLTTSAAQTGFIVIEGY